jgi:hypothetical protein
MLVLNSGFPPEGTGTYCTTRYWYTVLYVARVGYNMDTGTGKIIPINIGQSRNSWDFYLREAAFHYIQ